MSDKPGCRMFCLELVCRLLKCEAGNIYTTKFEYVYARLRRAQGFGRRAEGTATLTPASCVLLLLLLLFCCWRSSARERCRTAVVVVCYEKLFLSGMPGCGFLISKRIEVGSRKSRKHIPGIQQKYANGSLRLQRCK